jgi:hypothetical protein
VSKNRSTPDGADRRNDDPSEALLKELRETFRRLSPQGSASWNFSEAFTRLDREFLKRWPKESGHAASPEEVRVEDSARGLQSRVVARVQDRLRPWVDERAGEISSKEVSSALDPLNEAVGETLGAAVDALRFLAARVESLEHDVERIRNPFPISEAFDEPYDLKEWTSAVCNWLRDRRPDGVVVHARCGTGELLGEIQGIGFAVEGIESRADLAWKATEAGIRVRIGTIEEVICDERHGPVGAVILSGTLASRPVGDLVALVELLSDRLTAGGSLVVLARMPDSLTRGWDAVASDLAPGRALHPETFEFILHRSGFSGITRLAGDNSIGDHDADMFCVAGVTKR